MYIKKHTFVNAETFRRIPISAIDASNRVLHAYSHPDNRKGQRFQSRYGLLASRQQYLSTALSSGDYLYPL